jgi:O-antigen/teichoic acid export membrane protein
VSDVRSSAELTEATADGLRWISMARIGTELLLLGSMVVLARLIPPSAFGMFAIALIVQELAITSTSEGVGTALVQRKTIEREHLQGGFALALLLAAGLAIATLVLSAVVVEPLFGGETASLVLLAMPWFLLMAVSAPSYALLRRRLDFRRLAVLDITNSVVRSSSSIVLAAAFGLDAPALVLGGLAGVAAMTALGLLFAPVPLPAWRPQAIRDLLSYGGPASLAAICWAGFRNGDYAIVGARLGAAQAGFYYRGFQLAVEYQRKISMIMTSVAFPVLSRTGSTEEMFAMRGRMTRMLTIALFPLLTSLVVLAPVAVPWIFGPAWEPAVLPTQILAGAGAATIVIDAVGTVLMATGRGRALLGYGVAHFAVYIVAVLFASRWGLAGVSIAAVSVHMVFLVIAYEVLLYKRPERTLRLLWDDVAAATVSCLAFVAAAVPVDLAFHDAGVAAPLHMAAVGAVGAVAYLCSLRVCFPAAWQDLVTLLRRVLPVGRIEAFARRLPLPAGRSS